MSEDSIKEKIRDLLLSNDFKRLTYKKDEANIFKIINMADKEIVHSDMLAWLFNPYENHNLNDKVLKEILMHLQKRYHMFRLCHIVSLVRDYITFL